MSTIPIPHGRVRMDGRDPGEQHRVSTQLELLFDLTFVIAFGIAASQMASLVEAGHLVKGVTAFLFAMFGVIWAWVNYTWFASAFDTDDWLYRLMTMAQMVGVIVFAVGIPDLFRSIDAGEHLNNRVMVAGYVVMRLALVAQWARAAMSSTGQRRTACIGAAKVLTVSQIGWVVMAVLRLGPAASVIAWVVTIALELAGPMIVERRLGGTPWHPHHIAERYGLLAIIALGESIVGTVASLSSTIEANHGWTLVAGVVAFAGVAITCGMWWKYFVLPSGDVLAANRSRAAVWGYAHYVPFTCIAAVGAGLQVVGVAAAHEARIGPVVAALTVAIPLGVFLASVMALYAYLMDGWYRAQTMMLAAGAVVLAVAVVLAAARVNLAVCLLVMAAAPAVMVIGYERIGHRIASHPEGAAGT